MSLYTTRNERRLHPSSVEAAEIGLIPPTHMANDFQSCGAPADADTLCVAEDVGAAKNGRVVEHRLHYGDLIAAVKRSGGSLGSSILGPYWYGGPHRLPITNGSSAQTTAMCRCLGRWRGMTSLLSQQPKILTPIFVDG